MKGTIKWYNQRKGYGFILGEDGKDIFLHRSSIPAEIRLSEGDKVEYEIEDSDRGPKATNVKKDQHLPFSAFKKKISEFFFPTTHKLFTKQWRELTPLSLLFLFVADIFIFRKTRVAQGVPLRDVLTAFTAGCIPYLFKTDDDLMIFRNPSEYEFITMNSLFHKSIPVRSNESHSSL